MSAASAGLDRDHIMRGVDRVASSQVLHGSESLCRLLRFLVQHSLDHPGESIKEYEIATKLFGRSADFDPRLDPAIRVQVGRLRSKLVEYYATEGTSDPLLIEIPKGSYNPLLHLRPLEEPAAEPNGVASPAMPDSRDKSRIPRWMIAAATIAIVLAASAGYELGTRERTAQAPAVLRAFWNPFIDSAEPALIVFSNAPFVGRPESGLRYYNPARDAGAPILDHYTGIGEVFAIHELDRLFASLHSSVVVKRAQLLNWDDTKGRNVIFIGSTSENLKLRDLPWAKEFAFRTNNVDGKQILSIENLHPAKGELSTYVSQQSVPLTDDYALISFLPDISNTKSILMVAGLTTLGTEASVEYVCNPATVQDLLSRLNARSPVPFAALIHVKVSGGVPVHSELISARRL